MLASRDSQLPSCTQAAQLAALAIDLEHQVGNRLARARQLGPASLRPRSALLAPRGLDGADPGAGPAPRHRAAPPGRVPVSICGAIGAAHAVLGRELRLRPARCWVRRRSTSGRSSGCCSSPPSASRRPRASGASPARPQGAAVVHAIGRHIPDPHRITGRRQGAAPQIGGLAPARRSTNRVHRLHAWCLRRAARKTAMALWPARGLGRRPNLHHAVKNAHGSLPVTSQPAARAQARNQAPAEAGWPRPPALPNLRLPLFCPPLPERQDPAPARKARRKPVE
jgi:hypothetical protein